jgi:hypothetical protein
VLEEPARVAVVALGGRRQRAQPRSELVVADEAADRCLEARVCDLAGEELEESLELFGVPA